ncbi:ATPase [Novosphingobium sp. FGD1]|uniref:ATPase n=1 Tax=Novosphingobium silvae TaxID=2692619 RepID=A0A7X4GEC7_9SPHN|nr:ATPase [Novosphingobium silvae]MYL96845.1 ATPase [Novosphingobium silvae]
MAGEHRIIALGTSSGERTESDPEGGGPAPAALPACENWNEAGIDEDEPAVADEIAAEQSSRRRWPIVAAATAVTAWTALFIAGQASSPSDQPLLAQLPELIATWCVPVLLVGVIWLLAMRHSTREAGRFADVAHRLSSESASLERRLAGVNRELSLAREFLAAQSRDLESLGRLASERLSQNAERLQDLVRENGARVESISTVSNAALDNMEKLRGQLPVIANSAKDVTNNIANAGRTAHGQLEDMVAGFHRLNEFGAASTRQVTMLREQVSDTLEGFTRQCEQLEGIASARFAELAQRSDELRARLDREEADALSAMKGRASALSDEIRETRQQLDRHEAESLTSLRARLVALRDESDVVSRALRDAEERAQEALRSSLDEFSIEHSMVSAALEQAQQAAVEALAGRLAAIASEARQVDEAIGLRAERLSMEAEERQSRQAEQERHAIARIEHMLRELDAGMAERLERHRSQAANLADRAAEVTEELSLYEVRLATITQSAGDSEQRIGASLSALAQHLTAARATLASTDSEVEKLTGDSLRLLELIQASAKQTHTALPEGLAVSEDRLVRLQEGLAAFMAQLRLSVQGSEGLAASIGTSGRDLDALVTGLEQAQASLSARGADHTALFARLLATITEMDDATRQAADRASGALAGSIEALRSELAHAVEAIEQDSPDRIVRIAQSLGAESASAIDKAMRNRVAEISGQLEQAVARSAGVTHETTRQLHEQISKVDQLVGNLESRVADARREAEEQVDNDFARRAAIITESLNSNAIDIVSVVSQDIADTAWAAYLRGDRGIFTRRAVRLLDAGEVKAIHQLFERDDAFRGNVSRYIHDFESILRQVLSTRDGNALGVTLLSSDMGKLYVALAQGVERLRS